MSEDFGQEKLFRDISKMGADYGGALNAVVEFWKAEGERIATERIIKRLEEMPEHYWTRNGGFDNKLDRQEVIALVKENK